MTRTMMLDMQELRRPVRNAARLLALLCALAAAPRLHAQNVSTSRPQPTLSYVQGSEVKITGFIISRNGDSLLVRDETTDAISLVVVNDDTRISTPSGTLALGRRRQGEDTLIPGLKVHLRGTGGMGGEAVASSILFHASAQNVAEGVAAGTLDMRFFMDSATAANRDSIEAVTRRGRDTLNALIDRARGSIATINTRIDNLGKYDLSQSRTIFFASGHAELLPDARRTLDQMISACKDKNACVFEVSGFTDSRGSMMLNEKLSYWRSQSVVQYLTQTGGIALRDIATPAGYNESNPIATNTTSSGRAMNRRVEVRLLFNRALNQ
jgi:outer membrane protein OmpA-like peptidoglycan-associated protein